LKLANLQQSTITNQCRGNSCITTSNNWTDS